MTKAFDNLDEFFNIESNNDMNNIITTNSEEIEKKIENNISDVRKDYEYTRGNLYSIIEKGQEGINGILELAQETEQPRAYEVLGQLIKSVSDAAEKLLELQKKVKDIEEIKKSSGTTNVTNALFIGSTSELSKLLKSQKNQENNK